MNHFADFRRLLAALPMLAAVFVGCGGSSGDGPPEPPPDTLYVRESGSDGNGGTSPDDAFRSIVRAVRGATSGQTIIVGPGEYTVPRSSSEITIEIADIDGNEPLILLANPDGSMTNDESRAGEVLVDARNASFGFRVSRSRNVIIDGFRIERARDDDESAGIHVRSDSSDITIRNCELTRNRDGVRVQASENVLIFNNLFFDNNRAIRVVNSPDTSVINNTATDNNDRGISVSGASTGTFVRNNILQDNSNRNIEVESGTSADTYDGDFNLIFSTRNNTDPDDTVRPSTLIGENAVLANASFVSTSSTRPDYRLMLDSPAIDSGDRTIDIALARELAGRSATEDGVQDSNADDLGYHFALIPGR